MVELRHFLLLFGFNVKCYKPSSYATRLGSLMRNCHLFLLCILLAPCVVFHGFVCLVWSVNMVLEISGGIIRRDIGFPLDLVRASAKGGLCLGCLIRESC